MSIIRKAIDWTRKRRGLHTHRLSDGTLVRKGLRVVKVREVLEGYGLGHAYDGKVHVITSLAPLDMCRMVGIGPAQEGIQALARAPKGSEVTCKSCANWPEMLSSLGHEASAIELKEAMEATR